MTVKLSPVFNDAQLGTADGKPLSGGLLTWYISRTNTLIQTYSEATGSTLQSNPIVLNVRGEPDHPIWLTTNQNYTAVLTDSVGSFVRQFDDIAGVNDTGTPTISEWVLYAGSVVFIDSTHFSTVGDLTATFTAQRRLKSIVTSGQTYSTISSSVYAAGVTTVTVVNDSGVLDGLSSTYYGFLDPAHPSFDSSGINAATKSAFQNQSFTAFTTAGTSTAYTLTPTPAITAYTAWQRFSVKFNSTSGSSPTLQVSGVASPPLLKQYDSAGVKVPATVFINQIADVVFDGTDWVVMDNISINPAGTIISFAAATPPPGYLACPTVVTNVSRTTYATLFAAIGTLWGAGDGSTTFGIPFFAQGQVPIATGASSVGTNSVGAVIAHTHIWGANNLNSAGSGVGAPGFTGTQTGVTGSTGGAANLPAGNTVQFCVKY
jgi:hypothetical protein